MPDFSIAHALAGKAALNSIITLKRRYMRNSICLVTLTIALFAFALQAADSPQSAWVNVTSNVGGEKWGAYGVTNKNMDKQSIVRLSVE